MSLTGLPIRGDTADNALRKDRVQVEKFELLPAERQTKVVYLDVAKMKRFRKIRLKFLQQVHNHDGELQSLCPFWLRVGECQCRRWSFYRSGVSDLTSVSRLLMSDVFNGIESPARADQLWENVTIFE